MSLLIFIFIVLARSRARPFGTVETDLNELSDVQCVASTKLVNKHSKSSPDAPSGEAAMS
jgi:hypothetical protein